MEKRSRAQLLTNRIRLRLNPEEEPSKALLDLVRQLCDVSQSADPEKWEEFEKAIEGAVSKSQEILKAEWIRVKAGR